MVDEDVRPLTEVPSPEHITLSLKSDKHTVVFPVLPSTSFTEIKALLLLALNSRNLSSIAGASVPPPGNADLVELGLPKDKKDLRKGFVPLDAADQVIRDNKPGRKKTNQSASSFTKTPLGAGLSDNSILAFRFNPSKAVQTLDPSSKNADSQSQLEWHVEIPRYEDENV